MSASSYGGGTLAPNIRSRMVKGVNGLDVHLLEAGFGDPARPLVLLLHGFPDLAFGWRHLMPLLAEAGYHVAAPDQRGFGRTTGWANDYDAPLAPFGLLNLTRDALALVSALGRRQVALLVGHDFGSPVAAYCAIARPDVFRSVVLMSAPFPGVPALPFGTANGTNATATSSPDPRKLAEALAALDPPRVIYQHYLATRGAGADLSHPPQGLHRFLRTFFHVKSGDWAGNRPYPLAVVRAEAFAALPTYYVMERGKTMAQNVAPFEPDAAQVEACSWLTEPELAVYVREYERTGFNGALMMYRVLVDPSLTAELQLFSGRTIDVPALFVGGKKDWATHVVPGALDLMQAKATTQLHGVKMIEGAGHWIQQEKPKQLSRLLLDFASKSPA
jgi:pimeloyl-ACP methyl ester carboxylesterase